jgi:hypothetical protein
VVRPASRVFANRTRSHARRSPVVAAEKFFDRKRWIFRRFFACNFFTRRIKRFPRCNWKGLDEARLSTVPTCHLRRSAVWQPLNAGGVLFRVMPLGLSDFGAMESPRRAASIVEDRVALRRRVLDKLRGNSPLRLRQRESEM